MKAVIDQTAPASRRLTAGIGGDIDGGGQLNQGNQNYQPQQSYGY